MRRKSLQYPEVMLRIGRLFRNMDRSGQGRISPRRIVTDDKKAPVVTGALAAVLNPRSSSPEGSAF